MARNSELFRHWEILRTLDAPEADGRRQPERIEIEFDARIAQHLRVSDWEPSGHARVDVDGSVRLTLNVRADRALRGWILSFGALARVIHPTSLAEQILVDLEAARGRYVPRIDFELPIVLLEEFAAQVPLPDISST
jgi:predicted DNA-binding transcriptional regulator YafY